MRLQASSTRHSKFEYERKFAARCSRFCAMSDQAQLQNKPSHAVAVLILAFGASCFGNELTEFPPGLEPVAENTASLPVGTSEDPYPERLEQVHGDGGDFLFSHSRGYVHASAEAVLNALRDPEVVSDRRSTTSHTVMFGLEPDYDFSMKLSYIVEDVITVEWDEDWRYGILEGSAESPKFGAIAFQKVFGTSFINRLEGSMYFDRIEDNVVEVGFVEQLSASRTESDKIASYQRDVFNNILASVRGNPLPQF